MDIKFADTFTKSLKTLIWHESRVYKTWAFFRYDISRFIKNVWRFRKPLANHYWWDHHGMLMFMEKAITHMADNVEEHGMEIDETRLKKVAAMRRAVQLIQNYNQDLYIEMAEAELGEIIHHPLEFEPVEGKEDLFQLVDHDTPEEKAHNRKVYDRARELEVSEWNELMSILKGQDYTKFKKKIDWNKQFDGSGLKSWWD